MVLKESLNAYAFNVPKTPALTYVYEDDTNDTNYAVVEGHHYGTNAVDVVYAIAMSSNAIDSLVQFNSFTYKALKIARVNVENLKVVMRVHALHAN